MNPYQMKRKYKTIQKLEDYPLFYEETPYYIPKPHKPRKKLRTQNVFEGV